MLRGAPATMAWASDRSPVVRLWSLAFPAAITAVTAMPEPDCMTPSTTSL